MLSSTTHSLRKIHTRPRRNLPSIISLSKSIDRSSDNQPLPPTLEHTNNELTDKENNAKVDTIPKDIILKKSVHTNSLGSNNTNSDSTLIIKLKTNTSRTVDIQ